MDKQAIIVADLGYGDAGKGGMVDYLASQSDSAFVVRYNGGPQAAHNVVTPQGLHHTFAHVGSASFVPGVETHLSRYMLVNPFNLDLEIEALENKGVKDVWQRLSIDGDALVITPWHIAINRLRELSRGDGRHGSCGQGIGETQLDALEHPELALKVRDLANSARLTAKLEQIKAYKQGQLASFAANLPKTDPVAIEMQLLNRSNLVGQCVEFYQHIANQVRIVGPDYLGNLLDSHQTAIFEGAQAVLLDEWFGFHPYTTWSTTTFENALNLLDEQDYDGQVTKLGLIRGYAVRHGAGPFVTEDMALTQEMPDYHNGNNAWQRAFRVGYQDFVALKYAIEVCQGVDELAVTCLDRMLGRSGWQVATAYRHGTQELTHLEVGQKDNLDHQEKLTNILFDSRPIYQGFETPSGGGKMATREDFESYIDLIARELSLPVSYTSFGPTRAEKQRCIAPAMLPG